MDRRHRPGSSNGRATMKQLFILTILFGMTAVYSTDQVIVPKYYVTPGVEKGTYRVYDSRQIVVPKYIVRSNYDGSQSVYKAGKPVLPLYRIEKRWR